MDRKIAITDWNNNIYVLRAMDFGKGLSFTAAGYCSRTSR